MVLMTVISSTAKTGFYLAISTAEVFYRETGTRVDHQFENIKGRKHVRDEIECPLRQPYGLQMRRNAFKFSFLPQKPFLF